MPENPIIKNSTGLAARPCLKCCQRNSREWRGFLDGFAEALERVASIGVSPEGGGETFILDGSRVVGLLRPNLMPNPLVPPIIEPSPAPAPVPPAAPIRPWGQGLVWLTLAVGLAEAQQDSPVGLQARLKTAAAALRAVSRMRATNRQTDSCEQCIEPLVWQQDSPRVYEDGKHRRRL